MDCQNNDLYLKMLRNYRNPLVTDSNEEDTRYTYDCSTVTPEAKLVEITSMSPETKKVWLQL